MNSPAVSVGVDALLSDHIGHLNDAVASFLDDSSWAQGNAQLGYGDGDEATVVSFGPNASTKYRTTYFRRSITVANPANLDLRR